MNCAALSLILTASLLAGRDAAAQNMPPFKDATAVRELSFDEQRTWDASAQFSRQLEASGQIDADHDLTKFVQQLTDRLFPEFAGAIRARVLRSPALNAFVLANGDIYVNHGLLARMENEAQLASVIGHEGTHFTHRHVVRSRDSLNTARVLASILATFGDRGVSGLLGGLGLLSYSRDLEREADAGGMMRMRAAGFDLREAAHAYQHIEREVKVLEHSQASLLSTNPAIEERIDDLRRLGGGSAGGAGTDRSTYAQRFASLREAYLEELLSRRAVAQLLLLLEDAGRRAEFSPHAAFHLGEAYRLRAGKDDAERAERAYRDAIATAPAFAPSYRQLGVLCLKQKRYADAEALLQTYLQRAPAAPDRTYAEHYWQLARERAAAK